MALSDTMLIIDGIENKTSPFSVFNQETAIVDTFVNMYTGHIVWALSNGTAIKNCTYKNLTEGEWLLTTILGSGDV